MLGVQVYFNLEKDPCSPPIDSLARYRMSSLCDVSRTSETQPPTSDCREGGYIGTPDAMQLTNGPSNRRLESNLRTLGHVHVTIVSRDT